MAELPNIKPGDEVEARFKVREVGSAGVWGIESDAYVRFEHITEVIPAPKAIKVGDRVKYEDHRIREVLCIARGFAWIDHPNDHLGGLIVLLSDLTLSEDEGHG